jgi:predicted nucleotidyltransferase
MERLLSKDEIISFLKADKQFLKENFGVVKIGLFGSYANDRQTGKSDIDFLVEFTEPRFDWMAGLYDYMESRFDKKIEIVRKRSPAKNNFFERVEKEVIYA